MKKYVVEKSIFSQQKSTSGYKKVAQLFSRGGAF